MRAPWESSAAREAHSRSRTEPTELRGACGLKQRTVSPMVRVAAVASAGAMAPSVCAGR